MRHNIDKVTSCHLEDGVIGVYLSLADTSARVRNECEVFSDRDDPDAVWFQEGFGPDGGIWWETEDKDGKGMTVYIVKLLVEKLGAGPVKDWGRDIGELCPPKEGYHRYGRRPWL